MTAPVLDVANLTIEFGPPGAGFRAVDAASFTLHAGECIGIVGESGSGKSMTALATLRLLPGTARVAGRILVAGRDIMDLPAGAMREVRGKDIAMVFQEPMSSLNPVMTIGDQIEEALLLHEPLDRTARRARAVEMLGLVGMPNPEGRLGAFPHEFSGGMRQRVMIAMALACNPKILIADEPTTALDVTIQAQILDLLRKLRRELGTAVVLISHDFGVISDIADRVLVMYCGRIVESARIDAIFDRPAHPYTEGLLRSIPSAGVGGGRLYQIPGTVPSPQNRGQGCDFYNRCPKRMPVCLSAKPPLFPIGDGHAAACYAAEAVAA